MTDSANRKPVPTTKEPAQNVLNRFLQENNILIGTERPQIEFTESGSMIVHAPRVIAMYANDEQPAQATAN